MRASGQAGRDQVYDFSAKPEAKDRLIVTSLGRWYSTAPVSEFHILRQMKGENK
jgi:hypothetical protein